MRRHNAALVLDAVARHPGISRAGVASRTGLAKATVSSLVDRLVAAGLVATTGPQARDGRGRRGTGLSLSPAGPHGLGVEIGVDYLATCLVDLTGDMHAHRVRTGDNRRQSMRQVLARAARVVRTALADAAAMGVPVGGIGVAAPGLVAASGVLQIAPNLGWREVDLRAELAGRVDLGDLPVVIGNEANLAASAELMRGDLRDFVHVSGEVGIGAALVVGGALVPGVRGFAGEIGHVCVDPRGPVCGCAARGCLEAVAGQDALLRRAGITDLPPSRSIGTLAEQLASGDAAATDAVATAGHALGIALAAVVNVVDVPAVVLGGCYATLEPWLVAPLREELASRVVSATTAPVEVRRSVLGSEAAVRGAATAVVQRIIADPDGTAR